MQSQADAEAEIGRLLARQVAAWNAGDAAAWCRDFVPDADFVNILGMRYRGRDANVRRHAEVFAGIFHGSVLRVVELAVRVLNDGAASAEALLELSGFRGLPPGIRPTRGDAVLLTRMHYVLVREADAWQAVFAQNTAVMPLPLPPR